VINGDAPLQYYRYADGNIGTKPATAFDSAGIPDNGQYVNGVTIAPGLQFTHSDRMAAQFDGVDDYIKLPSNVFGNFPGGGPITFETWFNSTTSGVILGQTGAGSVPGTPGNPAGWVPAISLGTDGKIRAEMFWHGFVGPMTSPLSYNDGQWHHIVSTFEGNVEKLYIDGVFIGQVGVVQSAYAGAYDYYLGTGYTNGWPGGNGGWHFFNGRLDESAIYDRALNVAEIRAHYFAGITDIPEPGTLGLLALSGLALIGRRTRKA
jgi:hypothetical protein